jgi:hypothetical protein
MRCQSIESQETMLQNAFGGKLPLELGRGRSTLRVIAEWFMAPSHYFATTTGMTCTTLYQSYN